MPVRTLLRGRVPLLDGTTEHLFQGVGDSGESGHDQGGGWSPLPDPFLDDVREMVAQALRVGDAGATEFEDDPTGGGRAHPLAARIASVSAGSISVEVADDAVVGHGEDGGAGVLVDRHDRRGGPFMPTRCWIAPEMPAAM